MDGTGKGDFSRLEERPGLEMKGGLGTEQREAAGTRMPCVSSPGGQDPASH